MEATETAIKQAELLEILVWKVKRGHLWNREERKDARILCALLIQASLDHSIAKERSQQVQEAVG